MKSILLIGLGRFGYHIASKLNEMGHEVLAIDEDEEKVNSILPIVTNAMIGDCASEAFLASLGIDNFDVCIVTIGDDFLSSLQIVSILKDNGAKWVVARASKEIEEKFLLRNGADQVVYPEKQLAAWTAISCTSGNVMDYFQLDEDHSFFEIAVPSEWVGKTIMELDVRRKYGVNIIGVKENGELTTNIDRDTMFTDSMSVLILGDLKTLQKNFDL